MYILRIVFYLVSGSAAILWVCAAMVNIPVPTWDNVGPDGAFIKAFQLSAHLNAAAALATGISVGLSLLREVLRDKAMSGSGR